MIADNLNKLENDIKESYNSLNGFDIPENKNTDNLPNTIENAITTLKTYIPSATSENGTCENAVALNASVEVDGNSEQKTTEGYQLLDIKNKETTTSNGITYSIKDGIIPSISGTPTSTSYLYLHTFTNELLLKAGTYTLYLSSPITNTYIVLLNRAGSWIGQQVRSGQKSITFTLINDVRVKYIACGDLNTSKVVSGTNIGIMLYEGEYDENKTFEPYTGGQPSPSPEYPQDVEVIDGVNLFDGKWEIGSIAAVNGNNVANLTRLRTIDYIQVEPNINYVYSLDGNYTQGIVFEYDENKNFIKTSSWQSIPYKFVTENTTRFIRLVFQNNDKTMSLDDIEWCQINKGTTPLPYLPHGHIGLRQSGKNLFNGIWQSGSLDVDTGKETTAARNRSDYIEVKPSSKITLSRTANYSTYTLFYDNNKNFISYDTTPAVQLNKTLQVPNNACYFRIYLYTPYDSSITMQYEYGENATSYEPYHEPKLYPINLNGNTIAKVGDVRDKLRIYRSGKVELVKNVGKVILDGINNKFLGKSGTTSNTCLTTGIINNIKIPQTNNEEVNLYSNFFKSTSVNNIYTNNKYGIAVRTDGILFAGFTLNNLITNVDEGNEWLKLNNIEVIYPFIEPQIIELPSIEPIEMWEGTNIFELISNLDTTYRIKYYIDYNSILNGIQTALLDVEPDEVVEEMPVETNENQISEGNTEEVI